MNTPFHTFSKLSIFIMLSSSPLIGLDLAFLTTSDYDTDGNTLLHSTLGNGVSFENFKRETFSTITNPNPNDGSKVDSILDTLVGLTTPSPDVSSILNQANSNTINTPTSLSDAMFGLPTSLFPTNNLLHTSSEIPNPATTIQETKPPSSLAGAVPIKPPTVQEVSLIVAEKVNVMNNLKRQLFNSNETTKPSVLQQIKEVSTSLVSSTTISPAITMGINQIPRPVVPPNNLMQIQVQNSQIQATQRSVEQTRLTTTQITIQQVTVVPVRIGVR